MCELWRTKKRKRGNGLHRSPASVATPRPASRPTPAPPALAPALSSAPTLAPTLALDAEADAPSAVAAPGVDSGAASSAFVRFGGGGFFFPFFAADAYRRRAPTWWLHRADVRLAIRCNITPMYLSGTLCFHLIILVCCGGWGGRGGREGNTASCEEGKGVARLQARRKMDDALERALASSAPHSTSVMLIPPLRTTEWWW